MIESGVSYDQRFLEYCVLESAKGNNTMVD